MEDFEESDLQMDQLPGLHRQYLDSLVHLASADTPHNSDYHKYHHYLLEKFKEKWSDEEKNAEKKTIVQRESTCPRTCRFCGCVRRTLKIRTKKIHRAKRKFYILSCRFCGKSLTINKQGTKLPKTAPTNQPEGSTVEPKTKRTKLKAKPKPKPKPVDNKPKPVIVPITRPVKIEKFNHEDTIKQLNFLLKGGNGGKRLNVSQLHKSKLMDLLM